MSEHSNELIRQYWPKGADLSRLKDGEVQQAEDLLNNCPHKVPGFCTPQEVFEQALENRGCSVQEAIVNVVSKIRRIRIMMIVATW